jgi:hypothetical protein
MKTARQEPVGAEYWRFHLHRRVAKQVGFDPPVGELAYDNADERRVFIKAALTLGDGRSLVQVARYQGPGVPLAEECVALYHDMVLTRVEVSAVDPALQDALLLFRAFCRCLDWPWTKAELEYLLQARDAR